MHKCAFVVKSVQHHPKNWMVGPGCPCLCEISVAHDEDWLASAGKSSSVQTHLGNIARGTTDPEIDSVT